MRNVKSKFLQMIKDSGSALWVEMCGHQSLRFIIKPNSGVLAHRRIHASLSANLDQISIRNRYI